MADFPDSTTVTEIPRQIVEAEIEMLIDLLDTLDPDPDIEDGMDQEGDGADDAALGQRRHLPRPARGSIRAAGNGI